MVKARRQLKIQEIISKEVIRTQEELAARLKEEGFEVTQATVSRDIKELGLIKIPTADDQYRYAVPGKSQSQNQQERLKRMLRETLVSMDFSENLVVIRTLPGNAHALAELIDNSDWPELIGSVAGDNTILLVIKPKEDTPRVIERITALIGQ